MGNPIDLPAGEVLKCRQHASFLDSPLRYRATQHGQHLDVHQFGSNQKGAFQ